jgi:serine/threonine-protein kinase
MSLPAGTRIGPYEIVALLGAGGMGEVYRGRDSRLGRDVALKILLPNFAADADRMARFQREAQVLASLNHPHIASLYGLEESGSVRALVMELVEGSTLADRIKTGAVPLAEALNIASQIAVALDMAHEMGIVHRDLKPANIKVKPDGSVKVLDFGLAKITKTDELQSGDSTLTDSVTKAGAVLGTASYMAPEQARGETADKRADIWAFGVVVYEMLTGSRLFPGARASEILAAVLTREPDWDRVPTQALLLLRRCLEKDPKHRLRDIGDARFLLEGVPLTGPAFAPPAARPLPWIVAGVLAAALAASLWTFWRAPKPQDRPLIRLNVDLGPEAIRGVVLEPRISPDGTLMVFPATSPGGKPQLAVRSLDGPRITFLAGTENATSPFFSPDGHWIGFLAGGKLKRVPVQGGAVVTIADTGALGASWGEDQNIVFAPGAVSPLLRVSADGGKPQPLTKVGDKGDATHRWPQVLPGGRAVLFTSHKIVAGFDDATIEAMVFRTGERKTLVRGGYFGRYIGSGNHGYLLYVHEGVLFGVPFDPETLTVHGAPTPVLDDVAGNSDSGAGQFDVGGNGTLLYRSGKGPARNWQVLWMDSSGRTKPLMAEPGAYYTIKLSPDGNRLALTVDRGDKGREIEVFDLQRGFLSRLTFTGEVNVHPVWSPDGKYIAFESSSPRGYGIGLVRSDGSGLMRRLAEHDGLMIPTSFSLDGRWLVGHQMNAQTGFDIWAAPFDTSDPDHPELGKLELFLSSPFSEANPAFSPDGRWIAYTSDESRRVEVYVRPFRRAGGKWQVSTGGAGGGPVWAPNGRELYFRAPDNRIMVAGYTADGDSFLASRPRVWSDTPIGATTFGREFSLSPDGKRFAVLPRRDAQVEQGTVHVTVVLNLLDELRRRR